VIAMPLGSGRLREQRGMGPSAPTARGAVAAVYEGKTRREAACIGAMDQQTLRDWVHRFDAEGPAGLVGHTHQGPKLS
jgi:transposase